MNLKLGGGSYRETAMHAEACQNLKIETKSNNKLRLRCAEFLHRKTWCQFFFLEVAIYEEKTTSVEASTEGPHGRAPEAYHGTLA